MRKLTIGCGCVLGFGMILWAAHAMAQATGTASKAPAAQSTTAGTTTKAPTTQGAAKPQGAGTASQSVRTLSTPKDKLSYALGTSIAKGFKQDLIEVNPNAFYQGLKDVLAGAKPLMTDDEVKTTLTQLQNDLRVRQADNLKVVAAANLNKGAAFLAANKTKPGVITLPSGLQYKIITAGSGPKPAPSDTVVCNYRGTLIDGKEFDSSFKTGKPASFPVGHVIKGWTEALQLMPVGSKWQLFLPPDLAYGDHAAGPDIGPNATLIFEVELISIQGK